MPPAVVPQFETERLRALRALGTLRPVRAQVDRVVELLKAQFGVANAAANLVGEDLEHPAGHPAGCPLSGPREKALCAHVVRQDAPIIAEDASADERLRDLPTVVSGEVGFYFGVPIRTPDGLPIGSLCVRGPGRRACAPHEYDLLVRLADLLGAEFALSGRYERVETEHRTREEQLKLLIAHTPAAIAMFDRDMRYLAVSNRWNTDYGLGDAALIGRSHYEVFPEIPERWKEQHRRCLTGESLDAEQDRFERVDGRVEFVRWKLVPWHDHDGRVGGLVMFTELVTERVLAEQRSKDAAQRLQMALHAAESGLWDWNVTAGSVEVDPDWWRIHGHPLNAFPITLENLWDLVHPEDRPSHQAQVNTVVSGQRDTFQSEFRFRRADGTYQWFEGHGYAATHAPDGTAARIVGVNMNIHERKTLELRTRQHNEDLTEAKRMLEDHAARLVEANRVAREARAHAEAANAAKTRFLANMSHEIRTPLTAILGYTEILDDPAAGTERHTDCVRTIRQNGRHLLELINDILDLSKIEADGMRLEPIHCDPVQIVQDALKLVEPLAAAKSIALQAEIDPDTPDQVVTDPMRLRQILVNLLGNAVKFTQAGSVTVRLATGADNTITCEVIDTGIGMTGDQAARVFEPFVQADNSTTRRHGGTGLGLTISARLAKLLGGSLVITRTAPDQGTTVRLTVDRGAAARRTARPQTRLSTTPAQPDSIRGARILLAEDGPDNQRLLRFLLERAGATVTVVSDGLQAFESIRATPDAFDLVLMDMQMPEMDGYQATTHLRSAGVQTPVIALTANAMDGDRLRCIEAGCDDYASKPITGPELVRVCARWLGQAHRSENQQAA
jgi:PAS domain S-box-containing protein